MAYEIQLNGSEPEVVDADGYVQGGVSGVLTTFFQGRDRRSVLDSWAKRIASYRTADIIRIRWTALVHPRVSYRDVIYSGDVSASAGVAPW